MDFLRKTVDTIFSVNDVFEIVDGQQRIMAAVIFDCKADTVFFLELKNDRGAIMTAIKDVKEYLMYQIYKGENNIALSDVFEKIYLAINRIGRIHEKDFLKSIIDFLKDTVTHIAEIPARIDFIETFALELQRCILGIKRVKCMKNRWFCQVIPLIIFPSPH